MGQSKEISRWVCILSYVQLKTVTLRYCYPPLSELGLMTDKSVFFKFLPIYLTDPKSHKYNSVDTSVKF